MLNPQCNSYQDIGTQHTDEIYPNEAFLQEINSTINYKDFWADAMQNTLQAKKATHSSADCYATYLDYICIGKEFVTAFPNMFSLDHELYLLFFSWDYSGKPVYIFPENNIHPVAHYLPIACNNTRTYTQTPILLFPEGHLKGALNTVMFLVETHRGNKDFDRLLQLYRQLIKRSHWHQQLKTLKAPVPLALIQQLQVNLEELITDIKQLFQQAALNISTFFNACFEIETLHGGQVLTFERDNHQLIIDIRTFKKN